MQFDFIVAVDSNWGISKNGKLPWAGTVENAEDMNWFKMMTRDSFVIMGRKTYEAIGHPLAKRTNVIISSSYVGVTIYGALTETMCVFVNSFDAALKWCKWNSVVNNTVNTNNNTKITVNTPNSLKTLKKCMVIGGNCIYEQALRSPFLRKGYVTVIPKNYNCDLVFPQQLLAGVPSHRELSFACVRTLNKYYTYDFVNPSEGTYLFLLAQLQGLSQRRPNRTAVPTLSVFHETLKFNLSDSRGLVLPMLTTKRVNFPAVYHELMWFISGATDTQYLRDNKVTIWDGNTTKEFLTQRGLPNYQDGELGPGYGYQWRHAGAEYDCTAQREYITKRRITVGLGDSTTISNAVLNGPGIDQLSNVIRMIKEDPFSRRLLVSAWNVKQLDEMALVPCHYSFQFYVEQCGESSEVGSKSKLNCLVNMRSADVFLGVPFNICSYALLTHMVAHLTNLTPGELVISMADCHLYETHLDAAREQIKRAPRRFPTLRFSDKASAVLSIDEYLDCDISDFIIESYVPHPRIQASMVV